ncbi:cytochrome P450 [Trametes versicolor FP-101664 SS1]|uniref:cytochrome P450 n=1 Tax=Trametes versicolor (strain FP-101664) TaxID=717944 RepID=UPI0004622467|nr:cytochrome P450 [Trametes versicolor FP-101664 SS1]EIW61050.1 cytochrome P450 [Trametes versicolor FP-101664 SS1]
MDAPLYVPIALAASAFSLWLIFKRYLTKSPLDNLPGPPPTSFLFGNLPDISHRQSWREWEFIVDAYGPVTKLQGLLGLRVLHIADPKALHSVLIKDAEHFPKKVEPATDTQVLIGPGLMATDGHQHRKQRKLVTPVFSVGHLRNMTHIIYGVTHKLQEVLETRVSTKDGSVIDINGWMARATLEMLGQAGLGHSFDDFTEDSIDSYGEALKMFFPVLARLPLLTVFVPKLSYVFPDWLINKMLRLMPGHDIRRMLEISDAMTQRSFELINDRKTALLQGDEALAKQIGAGKDIMSLLLKANMTTSEAERHTDAELVAQMSTMLLGGMDTTANALSRILHILSQKPDVQERLRAEIIEARADDNLAYDDIVKLSYLEAVCRETMRLYPPAEFIVRTARNDTTIPLFEPVRARDGSLMTEVPVPKDTMILGHLWGCNTNKAVWGDDAYKFKPERWLGELPKALDEARVPGVYSNLMTFSGGGRSCIGFKLSQVEMKIVLSVLLSEFKFEMSDKPITWNSSIVVYPTTGDVNTHPEMFLKVTKIA